MGTMKLNKHSLAEMRVKNGVSYPSGLFVGDMTANIEKKNAEYVKLKTADGEADAKHNISAASAKWNGTAARAELMEKMEDQIKSLKGLIDRKANANEIAVNYTDLINNVQIDITRLRMQEEDWTDVVTQVVNNPNFSRSVDLQEFLPFVGEFQENNLQGQSVPLIEGNSGAEGSVRMKGYALGDARSLLSVLFDQGIYGLEKVNRAYERAHRGKRNDLSVGLLRNLPSGSARTYVAAQKQAADTTSGATYHQKLYNTLRKGLKKLGSLYDFQTGQEIDMNEVYLAVGTNGVLNDVEAVIRGQLAGFGDAVANRSALPISSVFKYFGDSFYFGGKKVEYDGIESTKAYLFVPGSAGMAPWWTLEKRSLTTVVSQGDAHTLSQQKQGRYFVQTEYHDEFFGSSSENSVITGASGNFGYVVEVTLPADS